MPKVKNNKKAIHPNSRKALQLSRKAHHSAKLERNRGEKNLKQQSKLNKLLWFKDNMEDDTEVTTAADMKDAIEKYIQRFDDEMSEKEEAAQIKYRRIGDRMKHQFGQQFSKEKDTKDFNTCGIEVPNLMKKSCLEIFRNWDGDQRYITNIDMVTLTRKQLDSSITKSEQKDEPVTE